MSILGVGRICPEVATFAIDERVGEVGVIDRRTGDEASCCLGEEVEVGHGVASKTTSLRTPLAPISLGGRGGARVATADEE